MIFIRAAASNPVDDGELPFPSKSVAVLSGNQHLKLTHQTEITRGLVWRLLPQKLEKELRLYLPDPLGPGPIVLEKVI